MIAPTDWVTCGLDHGLLLMQINDAYQADHDSRLMYSRNISESLAPYDCTSEPRFAMKYFLGLSSFPWCCVPYFPPGIAQDKRA